MNWVTRPITWANTNPRAVDVILIAAFMIGGVLTNLLVPLEGSQAPADVLAYTIAVLAPLTLWWRRTKPLIALPICAALIIIYWIADYAGQVDTVLWVQFYSATRYGGTDRNRVWKVVGVSLVVMLITAVTGVVIATEDLPLIAVFGLFFLFSTSSMIGEALYQRSQYVLGLEQRAAALEADLENKAALAAVEERTRIAREMHDIIAHGMSTVVVQAQAGQGVVEASPAMALEVLKTIEKIGRDSVDEMRRMLGVLRNDSGDLELQPQPGLADLTALRDQIQASGVDVDVHTVGTPRPLPSGLDLTGYRVVQEALTNVVRHGGADTTAAVEIAYTETTIDISVADNGVGAAASSATAGSGHGLLGMRERVEIYNGSFASGPRPGGGYQVSVSLPVPAVVVA